MALVTYKPNDIVQVNPTIELRTALQDFEAALDSDQLRLYKISNAKPTAESVNVFVAGLAAKNQGPHGRFLWKRLCPFLDASRQFTDIVSTFVSSNPTVTALVWGGLRTTLLAVSNAASYFDQVATLMMEIGRLSPTFAQFGHLYMQHTGLQYVLCRFYTVVFQICTKIIKILQRGSTSQFLASFYNPFQIDFQPLLDDLSIAKSEIRDQVSLASKQVASESAKLLKLESRENELHRRFTAKFRSEVREEAVLMNKWRQHQMQINDAKLRGSIRKNLSNIDYLKAWRLALAPRAEGTAEWFLQEDAFQKWKHSDMPTTMWVRGTMGSGKTVILANTVARLLEQRTECEVVCFHFCRSDHKASLSARNIVGVLARQILEAGIKEIESDALNQLFDKTKDMDVDGLVQLLLSSMDKSLIYYIVIDGLDECDCSDVMVTRRAISDLCHRYQGFLRVILSSRPDAELSIFGVDPPDYKVTLSPTCTGTDIEKYIDQTLQKCIQDKTLQLDNPELEHKIARTLKNGCDGMFLWARFFIGELCACLSDDEISNALERPPQGLSALIDEIVSHIKRQKAADFAMHTIEYCGVARRPLEMCEMQELLSVSDGQQSLERSKMPTNMDRVISACRGLVFVDEIENTIHHVHHSLKPHLFTKGRSRDHEFIWDESDVGLGTACLVYLDFSNFQRQLTKTFRGASTSITPLNFANNANSSNKLISGLAKGMRGQRRQSQSFTVQELSRKAEDMFDVMSKSRASHELGLQQYHLLRYAKEFWIMHLDTLSKEKNLSTWRRFARVVADDTSLAAKPWLQIESGKHEFSDPFMLEALQKVRWAVYNNNCSLLSLMLVEHVIDYPWRLIGTLELELEDLAVWSITNANSENFNTSLFKWIINAGGSSLYAGRALRCAAYCGLWRLVTMILLRASVAKLNDYEFAAPLAIYGRYFYSTKISAESMDDMTRGISVYQPHEDFVASRVWGLLAQKVTILRDDFDELVDLLKAARLTGDANIQNGPALVGVSRGRNLLLATALLKAGASPDGYALIEAIRNGYLELITALLEAGANPNSPNTFESPLLVAIDYPQDPKHVKLLIDFGADVNIVVARRTALTAAISHDLPDIVQVLIQAGADVNRSPSESMDSVTPLIQAVVMERSEIFRILMRNGADTRELFGEGVDISLMPPEKTLSEIVIEWGTPHAIHLWITAQPLLSRTHYEVGKPLIHVAAALGKVTAIKALISAGVNINEVHSEQTPLMVACQAGHLTAVCCLLEAEASWNLPPNGKDDALTCALLFGHLHIAGVLLAAGASTLLARKAGLNDAVEAAWRTFFEHRPGLRWSESHQR